MGPLSIFIWHRGIIYFKVSGPGLLSTISGPLSIFIWHRGIIYFKVSGPGLLSTISIQETPYYKKEKIESFPPRTTCIIWYMLSHSLIWKQ